MLDFSASPSSDDMPKRTSRSSRRRAVPKLRDSCTGCAASKVRCTKEKPSCSRCSRRGVKCEYIVTRRTGRTSCRTSQPVSRAPALLALRQPYLNDDGAFDDPFGSSMSMSNAPMPGLTPSSSGHASPSQPQVEAYPDMVWRGMVSPPMSNVGEMAPATYMSMAPDMDNIFDPTFSFAEAPIAKTGEQFGYYNPENFSTFGAPDFFPTSQPTPSHSASISSSLPSIPSPSTGRFGDLERSQSCSSNGASRSCLDNAITHLTRLLSSASSACQHASAPFPIDSFSNIHSTIAENRQIIESVASTLDCACAQDDYILVVLALVILKALARYSAAAHVRPAADHGFAWGVEDPFSCADSAYTPSSTSSVSSAGSSLFDDAFGMSSASSVSSSSSRTMSLSLENPNRPAAEKVLTELHRVREVISLLSMRMKERAARGASAAHNVHPLRRGSGPMEDGLLAALTRFPSAGFEQMEKDLQVRLREVSMEMIDILRRE